MFSVYSIMRYILIIVLRTENPTYMYQHSADQLLLYPVITERESFSIV